MRALVAGWESTIVQEIAERPQTLARLDSAIDGFSYAGLKRRLAKLRSAKLVTSLDGGRSPEHAATDWLRAAAGPIGAATRWEHIHAGTEIEAITPQEIEALLLLALPLAAVPADSSGTCVFASPVGKAQGNGLPPALAAVSLVVEKGEVVSCAPGTTLKPTTWALGTPGAWLDAVVEGNRDGLRLRGEDASMAISFVEGMHRALFENY